VNSTPERWRQVETLYHAALDVDPMQRAAFLKTACAGDGELCQEVESLLAAHENPSSFLSIPALEVLARQVAETPEEPAMVNQQVDGYRIAAFLGAGGMGEVYKAHDASLNRSVALKFLLEDAQHDGLAVQRLLAEARSAAALDHPFICKIYEVGNFRGKPFIAMEYVAGQTLKAKLREGPLDPKTAVGIAREIAEALQAAHAQQIVHRDLKPSNIIIDRAGHAKVMDFGLAERMAPSASIAGGVAVSTTVDSTPGTPTYMSPEQVLRIPLTATSDIFSLGIVLHEMVTGQRPFPKGTAAALDDGMLDGSFAITLTARSGLPADLAALIASCLQKDATARPAAAELATRLRGLEHTLAEKRPIQVIPWRPLRSPQTKWLAAGVTFAAALGAGWGLTHQWRSYWLEARALPRIAAFSEAGDLYEAYRLARQARDRFPADARVQQAIGRITFPLKVATDPAGAQVLVKRYSNPDEPWEKLGTTPLDQVDVPVAAMRWRIVKAGFQPFEGAPFGSASLRALASLKLDPVADVPAGMVRIPGGRLVRANLPVMQLRDFWIDRFEVTNREYKNFVDAGGYRDRKYWSERLAEDDGTTFEQLLTRFRDATGRPAPATWMLGTYPEGQAEYPVSGISWYEATAYCASVGKRLPTVFHWYKALGSEQLSDMLDRSNFGDGPVAVGSRGDLGPFGTYDMAGNVREWIWNRSGTLRFNLGGSWGEAKYVIQNLDARPPFDRSPGVGVRCARFEEGAAEALAAVALPSPEALFHVKPAGDEVFAAYRRMYAYDRTDLNAVVESVQQGSPLWRKEIVSFDAAYPDERVTALIFLPRHAKPPYQTVVWFPGDDVFFHRSSERLASEFLFDFIPSSGRALVYPIYRGMYERSAPVRWDRPNEWRDRLIYWSRDLGRTLDYLEARPDIDRRKIAYYGFSSGAWYGPVFQALDRRFAASILLSAGICLVDAAEQVVIPPEMNAVNFAPRVTVPTLMINGRADLIWPVDLAQRPLFQLLGASTDDKRHIVLEGGHIPSDRPGMTREIVSWLDRHLGPVN
jgi:predicted esterase/predicted Ser/Thr protein kinase